jgi:hypothetical protein
VSELSGLLGDIFWDLTPAIVYTSGAELGATIYVANPTVEEKEYALMARLSSDDTVISEESVRVFGVAWFKVDPGEFIRLHGAFKFDETDVALTLLLIERETGEIADVVSTYLVSPAAAASGWPIGWPGGTSALPSDLSWLMPLMVLGIGVVGMMAATSGQPEKEKEIVAAPAAEQKLLPPGRDE